MARTETKSDKADRTQPHVFHGQVLSQAELISHSLKAVSREIRRPPSVWSNVLDHPLTRTKSFFALGILAALFLVVIVPVVSSGVYLAVFASDQYASEMRFAVRGSDRGSSDIMASLTGAGSSVRAQDALIVSDYIRGQGMVEELERSLKLRDMFAPPKSDLIFGFNPIKPIEKLVRYWRWQIDVNFDSMSGIITVIVRAFTPEDALAIAQAVITSSEKLVNDLSDRARRDSLKHAQSELSLAEVNLQSKIKEMRELRNREGVLDAGKTSEAMTKLTGDLALELARMESEYNTQIQSVSESSPQMRILAARIRSAKEQIRLMEGRMTTANPNQTSTATVREGAALAESIGRFDRLRLEQEFAQKRYVEAAAVLERARIELDTQQVYLTTFLQPVLAQDALYPKRMWIFLTITAICLAIWGAGTGIAVLVRNYGTSS